MRGEGIKEATCGDLLENRVPRRNSSRNPEFDPVEQRPLVSAVYSVVDDLGGHCDIRGSELTRILTLSLTLPLSWVILKSELQPSRTCSKEEKRVRVMCVDGVVDVVEVVRVSVCLGCQGVWALPWSAARWVVLCWAREQKNGGRKKTRGWWDASEGRRRWIDEGER